MKYKNIKLGEVAEITMGQSPKSTYYNKEGMGIPFIQGVSTFEDNYPKIETYTTKYNKEAQKGDLLFSVRAPVGRINVANQTIAIGRGLASLKVKKGYSKSYIYYLFKKIGNQLDSIGSGTVFSSINKKELINLKIRVPEKLHDQCKIADRLRKIDEEIEINNQINDNLMLQKYFSNKFSLILNNKIFSFSLIQIRSNNDKFSASNLFISLASGILIFNFLKYGTVICC
ncbi:restriction endonuclease subunit S [uncultured Lactobacillus sp.]|uniref:restriction endonuclease subunit S n=1 Tax=uncultured Lactobacillus sp. TaxID=153152 RepID=UPI0025DE97D7|nr:restriction endonuclease subunit S [uncultured Lactobacillus sp.]